ncbi:MAG: PEP-CTERM sorting domain-containing protein [Bryobacterales bacterium]|nr:PEP-CTERM sorting domain-containing protein [Bryobacterales bacterium]
MNSLSGATGEGNFNNAFWFGNLGNPRILVAREYTVDLKEFQYFPDPFNWAVEQLDIDPFLLGEGDEFDFTVRFLPGQSLQGDGSVRLEEYVGLTLLAAVAKPQPFGLTLTDVTTRLLGLQGVGASGEFTINGQDCLNCVEFGGDYNISDGVFSYTGARFQGRVAQMTDTSEVGRLTFSSFLGNPAAIETPAPVPEPGTWVLSLVGLLGLMAYRRRMRHNSAA